MDPTQTTKLESWLFKVFGAVIAVLGLMSPTFVQSHDLNHWTQVLVPSVATIALAGETIYHQYFHHKQVLVQLNTNTAAVPPIIQANTGGQNVNPGLSTTGGLPPNPQPVGGAPAMPSPGAGPGTPTP